MASLLCCAACEAGTCACSMVKCLFTDGKMGPKMANATYLIVFVIMSFIAFVLQHWGAPRFDFYSFHVGCEDIPNIDQQACQGENAVYRICIGMSIWFVFLSIVSTCTSKIHRGLWGIKILFLIVLTTGLFFTPIVGQPVYVQFARAVSGFFLVSQIVAFIDVAYRWNSFFVDKAYNDYDGENKTWLNLALIFCLIIALGTISSIILLYVNYNNCTRQMVFITISAVLVIGATLLQLHAQDTDSSLMTSCIVGLYVVYLCWVAVSSDECNHEKPTNQRLLLGCLVTTCSLAWTCYSVGTQDVYSEISDEEDPDNEEDPDSQSMALFHGIMAIGSIYISMLLTKWGTTSGHYSDAQMWVSIVSQWISVAIYIWTILAPRICSQRDFEI
jgi:serine incorporator 1/3